MYGAVSNRCEQFGMTENEEGQENPFGKWRIRDPRCTNEREVTSSEPSGIFSKASGISLRENIQDFESLSETIQFTRVCEDASFWHRVSAGVRYKARPDERFWTNHPIMPRRHTFVSKPTIQSTCSNSWRNSFRTSY